MMDEQPDADLVAVRWYHQLHRADADATIQKLQAAGIEAFIRIHPEFSHAIHVVVGSASEDRARLVLGPIVVSTL